LGWGIKLPALPDPNSSERGGGLFQQKIAGTVKGVQRENRGKGGKIPHTQQKKLISPHII